MPPPGVTRICSQPERSCSVTVRSPTGTPLKRARPWASFVTCALVSRRNVKAGTVPRRLPLRSKTSLRISMHPVSGGVELLLEAGELELLEEDEELLLLLEELLELEDEELELEEDEEELEEDELLLLDELELEELDDEELEELVELELLEDELLEELEELLLEELELLLEELLDELELLELTHCTVMNTSSHWSGALTASTSPWLRSWLWQVTSFTFSMNLSVKARLCPAARSKGVQRTTFTPFTVCSTQPSVELACT